jgi:Protein of unknown function (DUF1573)
MASWMRMASLGGVVWLAVLSGGAGTAAASWANGLFDEQSHDFGPVPRGGKFRHDFRLTNRLAEPITIINVRASCGCTTGRAVASQVAPGQATVVEAEMDTRNFVGAKVTTLYVSVVSAGGQESEARLGVSANILSDIVLNPGTIDFGAVTRGRTPELSLTVDRVGAPSWKVERMVTGSRVLGDQLVETTRDGSTVQYLLRVAIKPDAPAGFVRDEIRLLTNDPESPTIPIPVTASIRSDLTASPGVLTLGRVASAGGAQGRFLVRASRPFSIVSVEGDGDGFKAVEPSPNKAAAHILAVSYKSADGRPRGDFRHVFRVVTDLPGEPPLELVVTGHAEP